MLKSLFAIVLMVTAVTTMAQDSEPRTELPSTCLTVPTTLASDTGFEFNMELSCQVWNYIFSVYNAEGTVVFETQNPGEVWNASAATDGNYTWKLLGTTGNTIDYEHIIKEGSVTVAH